VQIKAERLFTLTAFLMLFLCFTSLCWGRGGVIARVKHLGGAGDVGVNNPPQKRGKGAKKILYGFIKKR
jgi:hypothetical protein